MPPLFPIYPLSLSATSLPGVISWFPAVLGGGVGIHIKCSKRLTTASLSSSDGCWATSYNIDTYSAGKKNLYICTAKKNFTRKILISFLLIAPAKNIVSIKRLQLRHMLVFRYTLSPNHCSACFVLLYSWLNNRSIKLNNIFHFLKF